MRPPARRLLLSSMLAGIVACAPPPPPVAPPPPAPAPLRAPDWSPPAPDADPHSLEIRLKPVPAGEDATLVEVALRFSEPPGEFGEPRPLSLTRNAVDEHDIEEVSARDAEGALPLRSQPAGAKVEWRSQRRPVGAVSVSYRVRGGGGSRALGGGSLLLLLPETTDTYRVRVSWDLAALGPGARAATSFGLGDVDAKMPIERLRDALFLAGKIGRISIEDADVRFEGAWLERPAYDPVEAIAFASRVHTRARALFGEPPAQAFTVLVIPQAGSKIQGAPQPDGLTLFGGEQPIAPRELRFSVAENVVWRWIGGSHRGLRFTGAEEAITTGLGFYFMGQILLAGGLCAPEEVAEYLTDRILRDPSGRARALAYAADVDAAIRARSGGKRALADLVRALLEKARSLGQDGRTATLPEGAFREAIGAELGADAQARFDAAMVRGEPVTPPAGAFGPCLTPVKKRVPGKDPRAKVEVTVWARDPKVPAERCR